MYPSKPAHPYSDYDFQKQIPLLLKSVCLKYPIVLFLTKKSIQSSIRATPFRSHNSKKKITF